MAEWIRSEKTIDEWEHHECSSCGTPALFYEEMVEDIDYDYEEEPFSWGQICIGIHEFITDFCPKCGSPMNKKEAMRDIYSCEACVNYNQKTHDYGQTEICKECGEYSWTNDDAPSKFELRGEM